MSFILNIGLARKSNSNIGPGTALRALADDFVILAYNIRPSDTEITEITVVAEVINNFAPFSTYDRVFHRATALGQDCIAANNTDTEGGVLIGPDAAAWGAFNPEFFLLLDGTRLAAPMQVAAGTQHKPPASSLGSTTTIAASPRPPC